jgi:superfamily II DNA or RNA helicase
VEAISAVGLTAHFIYGKTPKRRRDELLRSFERREFDVLVGGKIINRGLDLSGGCENLIIATGGKLQSEFEQKIGRALRLNRRGKSRVFDFFFRCNKYLYNHSKARLKVMVSLEYDSKVIFPGGVIDGTDLIKKKFRVQKNMFVRQKRLL